MTDKFEIIKKLEEYRLGLSNIKNLAGDKPSILDLKSLLVYAKNHIHNYIENVDILKSKFSETANHYNQLNDSKEYKELIEQLYTDINAICKLIDTKTAMKIEEEIEHFKNICYNLACNLNIGFCDWYSSVYEQLIYFLENRNNYYGLDFDDVQGEITSKIIRQYVELSAIIPADEEIDAFIDDLIIDPEKYDEIYKNYDSNVDKLKKMLIKIPKENYYYDFYVFSKSVNSNYSELLTNKSQIPAFFEKWNQVINNVLVVLSHYVEEIEFESEQELAQGSLKEKVVNFPKGYTKLTERQKEVFNLLHQGMSDKEIAEKLKIKKTTVNSHNKKIFGKLDIDDRKLIMKY